MSDNGWNPWTLESDATSRERFTGADIPKGQTEFAGCKYFAFNLRRIEEIVAARIDPVFKTKSDVFQDALSMWIEDWDKRYPDGVGGGLAYQSRLLLQRHKRERRERFIDSAREELDSLQKERDVRGVKELLQILLQAQGDFKDDTPESFMAKIEDMIQQVQRLLTASRAD